MGFGGLPKLLRRLLNDRQGATAVEFALATPIYFLALFALIEAGRLAYAQGAVMFAAQETTRYATVHYDATEDELKDVAASRVFALRKERIAAVDVDSVLNPADQTKRVTVALRYRHELLLPLLRRDGITLAGESRGFLVER